MKDGIIKQISLKDVDIELDAPLREHSFMRLVGTVAAVATPSDKETLISLIRILRDNRVPFLVVGRMSNVCPITDYYDGVLIKTKRIRTYFGAEESCVCDCGASIAAVASFMSRHDFGGAEPLCHIPATVGGMIRTNAGAYGRAISDLAESVTVFDPELDEVRSLDSKELDFGYRRSVLLAKDYYVLSCNLKFVPTERKFIKEKITELGTRRRLSQPLELPSLGSAFRAVDGVGAGYYIDRAGLKGLRIGDAAVSLKHAGFIVNLGSATPTDVVRLAELIKERVFKEFGIALSEEIHFFEGD